MNILNRFKLLCMFSWMGLIRVEIRVYDHGWFKWNFESNMIIWIELDRIWMLDVLVACKWMSCKFCLNGWFMENFICDHNELFEYQ